jgi:hypothetical protein
MPDVPGTEGQTTTGTQPSAQTPPSGAAPEGFVEKARLDGALQKIQELTLANRALSDQVAALTQEKANLMAEIGNKESGWKAEQSEFTTKLESANKTQTELEAQLAKSKALELKMKVIGDLNAPQLYSIISVLPDSTDEAVIKEKATQIASFAGQISKSREQELLAGVTLTPQSPATTAKTLPTTNEGWQQYVNSLNFGSPEYQTAMDSWHSWLFKQS